MFKRRWQVKTDQPVSSEKRERERERDYTKKSVKNMSLNEILDIQIGDCIHKGQFF